MTIVYTQPVGGGHVGGSENVDAPCNDYVRPAAITQSVGRVFLAEK